MKVIFTVDLTHPHAQDADLLKAYIRDAVANFNIHTRTAANVGSVHLLSDAFEVKKGPTRRLSTEGRTWRRKCGPDHRQR